MKTRYEITLNETIKVHETKESADLAWDRVEQFVQSRGGYGKYEILKYSLSLKNGKRNIAIDRAVYSEIES